MELKHRAAYLQYAPKVKKNSASNEMLELSVSTLPMVISNGDKLILRPMSHLTKEISHKGKKFVPIVELLKLKDPEYFERNSGTRYAEIEISITENKSEAWVKYMAMKEIKVWHDNPSEKPHWLVEKLREWHFDVFGLIEKGEAIAKE